MSLKGIVAVLLSIFFGVSAGSPRSTYVPPRALWGNFVATTISDRGRSVPFSHPGDVEVGLEDVKGKLAHGRWIGWEANCNGSGARVKVTPRRLDVGLVTSTLIGCPPQEAREDNWLWDFFEADPRWRLDGSQLVLRAGQRVIRLKPKG